MSPPDHVEGATTLVVESVLFIAGGVNSLMLSDEQTAGVSNSDHLTGLILWGLGFMYTVAMNDTIKKQVRLLKPSRREFLAVSGMALTGLALGYAVQPVLGATNKVTPDAAKVEIGAYVQIHTDGMVSIFAPLSEMGQGVFTSLPLLIAEELDLEWAQVQVRQSAANSAFINPLARDQYASNSRSVRGMYLPLRTVGAGIREMLIQAAAEHWGVNVADIRTQSGRLFHDATDKSAAYAEFADAASRLPVPEAPRLKPPADFHLIGQSIARKDIPAKTDGSAIFGVDTVRPGMRFAAIRHAPIFNGKLQNFHAPDEAGDVRIVQVGESAVAAVAGNYWTAQRAVDELPVEFEPGPHDDVTDAGERAAVLKGLEKSGRAAINDGDAIAVINDSNKVISADYTVPFLAHTTMEPMSCVADVGPAYAILWAPTQAPRIAQKAVAKALDLSVDQVTVHHTFLGGGFGRRAETDFAVEAALLSQSVQRPVKLVWSREEDVRHDFYRPAYAGRYQAAIDQAGYPEAIATKVAGPSLLAGRYPELVARIPDPTVTTGQIAGSYDIPNRRTAFANVPTVVPVGFWRSVSHSMNTFFCESFIDELASNARIDPLIYRLHMLRQHPRQLAVLNTVAERSGWNAAPEGHAQGLAFCECYDSMIAQVVEISMKDRELTIHRITSVVDCGLAVDPRNVEAQIEGATIYGLTAVLMGKITIREGVVQQSNFNDYPALRMNEVPEFNTHLIQSSESPGGVGETGTPVIAPALANAIFRATGERVRDLPLSESGFRLRRA